MNLSAVEPLDLRMKVLVYIASLGDEENAFELYRYVPDSYEKSLVEATRQLLSLPKKERSRVVVQELKKMIRDQKAHHIGEIDAGWFLEVLRSETPRTVGLVLRNLPGEKARFIVQNLPPELRKKLPKTEEVLKVPEGLVEVIRGRFESRFPTLKAPEKTEEITIHHLYFIKTEQMLDFFRDLGLEQLARAFKGIDKTALKALINRLPFRDAREFQSRLKQLDKASKKDFREAQMLLLNLPLETIDPEALFLEVGIAFFSRAIMREDAEFIRALQFKLPPKYGYLLKRYVDGTMLSNKPRVAEWAKKQVLENFQKLPTDQQ